MASSTNDDAADQAGGGATEGPCYARMALACLLAACVAFVTVEAGLDAASTARSTWCNRGNRWLQGLQMAMVVQLCAVLRWSRLPQWPRWRHCMASACLLLRWPPVLACLLACLLACYDTRRWVRHHCGAYPILLASHLPRGSSEMVSWRATMRVNHSSLTGKCPGTRGS
jgi:hypothetical protein